MIHLTARALEWLQRNGEKGPYREPGGARACTGDVVPSDYWCRVEDVRAMAKGWQSAYFLDVYGGGQKRARSITRPTCPECSVLLDAALEKFTAPPKPPPDTTEAEVLMQLFGVKGEPHGS